MRNDGIDVVVIGGGPAGSTCATMLARKGLRVVLLERERFPRDHVGESLLPASLPVLEELGVLPAIQKAGFLPKWGATMVWGKESNPWSWYFKETNQKNPHSYQVWRPTFDHLLLDNSKASQVEVLEDHTVTDVVFDDSRAVGVRYITDDSSESYIACNFVVDASGQAGLLSHRLGLRQWDTFFRNMAVYSYFEGAKLLPQPDENNIFIESYENGWFWNIPLHTGQASVGVVVDSQKGQDGIKESGLLNFFNQQIQQAPYTSEMLSTASMTSGPFVVKDWSYVSERMAGDGYVLAGDAACFVDPLFSSGVHLALMSGVMAAAYVTSALEDEGMREAAGQAYQELYLKEYNHFRELALLFYSSNRTSDSYFWEARRIFEDDKHDTPRQAFIHAVAGQPPRGYERAVIERGHIPLEVSSGIHQVESERASRRTRLASENPEIGLLHAVPQLADNVRIERKPVLAEGEFVWSYVIASANRSEGMPCSGLVAKMVSLIDGGKSVEKLISEICKGLDDATRNQVQANVVSAVQILYVDGIIETLRF